MVNILATASSRPPCLVGVEMFAGFVPRLFVCFALALTHLGRLSPFVCFVVHFTAPPLATLGVIARSLC